MHTGTRGRGKEVIEGKRGKKWGERRKGTGCICSLANGWRRDLRVYDTPTAGQCKRTSLSLENSCVTPVSTHRPFMQLPRLLFKHPTGQQCSRPELSTAEQSGWRSHSPGTSQGEKEKNQSFPLLCSKPA